MSRKPPRYSGVQELTLKDLPEVFQQFAADMADYVAASGTPISIEEVHVTGQSPSTSVAIPNAVAVIGATAADGSPQSFQAGIHKGELRVSGLTAGAGYVLKVLVTV